MRKTFALFAFANALVLSFALGTGEAVPSAIVVAALKGPTGIGMVRLFEEAPKLPAGTEASFETVASADIMTAKVLAGEVDLAVLPLNMAAKLYAGGSGYRLAAVVGDGMVSVVSNDPAVRTIADLKGREVYVAGQAATPDYVIRLVMKAAGIDPDTGATLLYGMPYPEMAAAVSTGRIQIAVLPEPFATLALAGQSKASVPFDLGELWKAATKGPNYPMSVVVVKEATLKKNAKAVKAILDAYRASIAWVVANPKEAGALAEKHEFGLKAPVAAQAIPRSAYVFESAPKARKRVEAFLAVFLDADPKSVGGKLPDGAFYADIGLE